MKFRYARHTTNITRLLQFYVDGIGLEILGQFHDHSKYDGIFLGFPEADWHLEFTQSTSTPRHHPDRDDLLVFYMNSSVHLDAVRKDLQYMGFDPVLSENPYWLENGIEFIDPDGFGIVLTVKNQQLVSRELHTKPLIDLAITTWDEAIRYVQELPYGRNESRTDLTLVLKEGQGTCSSKHAYLAKIAQENKIDNVKLILGIYKMNGVNTPQVNEVLSTESLNYIPEAHCYLLIGNKRVDVTLPESDIKLLENAIIEEIEIQPQQVSEFKVEYHKKFLQSWIKEQNLALSFEELWSIRERCIMALSQT